MELLTFPPSVVPAPNPTARRVERDLRRVLVFLGLVTALAIAAQCAVMVWAQHEFTQVESIVGFHATDLADRGNLYYSFNRYPFTISPYTPGFYLLSAAMYRLGLPVVRAGRVISFLAFVGIVMLSWRILQLYTAGDRYASWAGTLAVASTANLLVWGTAGQVDTLALFFSLAAWCCYSEYQKGDSTQRLALSGLFIFLAVFTKQTMMAAGAAIFVLLAFQNRRRAFWFAAGLASAGGGLAVALNLLTSGSFYDNTVWANVNPLSPAKFFDHLQYLALAGSGLTFLVVCGLRAALKGRVQPLYLYLAFAAAALLGTAPKIGSDLNYQIETLAIGGLCAGWTLHKLQFFPRMFRSDRTAVTLLHIPLLFHVGLNLCITGRVVLSRIVTEHVRRDEYAMLRPYFEQTRGRILSVEVDPLLHAVGRIEVEPLIYTLLVQAGRVNPEPVRRDLAEGAFGLVVLYEDVFTPRAGPYNPELPSLPAVQLEEVRKNYRLIAHVPGALLDGSYIYRPIESPQDSTR